MSLLKFDGMGDTVYVFAGDSHSGDTVHAIYLDAIDALLSGGSDYDFTSFQETLDRINNNHNQGTGSHVLVCPTPPEPDYT